MLSNFNTLDPVSLKAFYFAAESLNFTRAARLANLTQSGISQHIQRLEDQLEISLFNRNQRKVELTEEGLELLSYVENYQLDLENFFEKLKFQTSSLSGSVNYGMPASCLKTPHFPILLEKRQDFLEVEINVSICPNEVIFEKLINSELDFGFVTKKSNRGGFEYIDFAKEQYVLVGNSQLIENFDIDSSPFVFYPGMEVLFEYWKKKYFPKKSSLNLYGLKRGGSINDLDGAITMCKYGLGVSLFPAHCVANELEMKSLKTYSKKSKQDPSESIYIVSREERAKPMRVRRVIQAFLEMK